MRGWSVPRERSSKGTEELQDVAVVVVVVVVVVVGPGLGLGATVGLDVGIG